MYCLPYSVNKRNQISPLCIWIVGRPFWCHFLTQSCCFIASRGKPKDASLHLTGGVSHTCHALMVLLTMCATLSPRPVIVFSKLPFQHACKCANEVGIRCTREPCAHIYSCGFLCNCSLMRACSQRRKETSRCVNITVGKTSRCQRSEPIRG